MNYLPFARLPTYESNNYAQIEMSSSSGQSYELQWTRSLKYPIKNNQYYFQLPYNKYYELVTELGPPSLVDTRIGGCAVWDSQTLLTNPKFNVFKKIVIIDEQCYNTYPHSHIGFLYTVISLHIPLNLLNKVLSISGDITYDPIKHWLSVRGMSIGWNITMLSLIKDFVRGNISWYSISNSKLVRYATSVKKLTNQKYITSRLRNLTNRNI